MVQSCPNRLETVGLAMPNRNFRDFNLFFSLLSVAIARPIDALRRVLSSVGILVCWYTGILVYLCTGILVYWYIGIFVHWYIGILVYWYIGIFVYWYIGILVYWYNGILVYWYINILVYWYINILVYWYIVIPVYWHIGVRVYLYTGILLYLYIGIVVYWYIGIFRGRSVLINDLLDADIFTKYIKTLNRLYAVVRSVAFLGNCSFNLVIFCTCFLLFLPL